MAVMTRPPSFSLLSQTSHTSNRRDVCSSQAPSDTSKCAASFISPSVVINPCTCPYSQRIDKAWPFVMAKPQFKTKSNPASFIHSFSTLETRTAIFRSSSACSAAVGTIPIACSTCDDVQSPIDAHAITPIPNNARVLGDRDL